MARPRRINKQYYKLIEGSCRLCPCSDYVQLDVHRIVSGSQGGQYTRDNTVTVCANCHRLIHSGYYKIDRWYTSTMGRRLRILAGPEQVEYFR